MTDSSPENAPRRERQNMGERVEELWMTARSDITEDGSEPALVRAAASLRHAIALIEQESRLRERSEALAMLYRDLGVAYEGLARHHEKHCGRETTDAFWNACRYGLNSFLSTQDSLALANNLVSLAQAVALPEVSEDRVHAVEDFIKQHFTSPPLATDGRLRAVVAAGIGQGYLSLARDTRGLERQAHA